METTSPHLTHIAARGNGQLRLSGRELRAVDELVDSLVRSLRRRLPHGLELLDLELELGRARAGRRRPIQERP